MKKILISIVIAFLFAGIKAETPVKFGVTGGLNYSTVSGLDENGWKVGYKAGVSADLPLGRMLSFQPSLLFSSKGYQTNVLDVTITDGSGHLYESVDLTANANYIELPLMFAVKLPLSEKFKLTVSAGPYVAYGVAGKTKLSSKDGDYSFDWDTFNGIEVLNQKVFQMEKFDWGFGLGAAVEMSKIKLSLNYDQGAQKVYDTSSYLVKTKDNYNYGFWLGLGVFF